MIKKPEIIVGNDMFGMMVGDALDIDKGHYVSFRREYHPDGSPAPRVDLNYTLTDYNDFSGKKVLTVYRRRQLPTRDTVARHLVNYPRLVFNLSDPETFGAGEIDVLYPYWLTSRQDHNPRKDPDDTVRWRDRGRGIEYKFDARAFKSAGAGRVLTFHPHFHREPGVIEVEGLEVVCLDAVPSMVRYAREELGMDQDCLITNPDFKKAREGKYDIALEFAKVAELDCSHLEKSRLSEEEVDTKGYIDAKGRRVLIVDDIGSTFGTVANAESNITNAPRIDVLVVHAVLPNKGHSAANALMGSDNPIKSISATHTIDSDFSRIPVHEEVAEFYRGNSKYPARD